MSKHKSTPEIIDSLLQRIDILERTLGTTGIEKSMLSTDEAARYLRISTSYLYKLSASNQIRHSCPGGKKLYFHKTDLDEYMQKGKTADPVVNNEKATDSSVKKRK